jgi:hypothetical protein
MLRFFVLFAGVVAATLAAPAHSQAQEKLELKYQEGHATKTEVSQNTHQVMTINGSEVETNASSIITVSSAVGQRQGDGTLPIKSKIESIFSQMSLPGGLELTFDSNSPNVESDNPQLKMVLDSLRALSGSSYTTTLDKNNRATSVTGTREVLDTVPAEIRPLLEGQLNPEYLKQVFNQEIDRLPQDPVTKGDTWLRSEVSRLGGGQQFTFQTLYEYAGNVEKEGKTLDKISMTHTGITYEMEANAASPAKVTQSNLSVKDSQGTLLFDRQRGVVVEARNTIEIEGDMTLSVNGMDLPLELDLKMETASILKD